jgi:NADH-quinone oxidoreductase subunit L
VLTAYYMTRLYVVAFLGEPKSRGVEHAHESPAVMTGPLVVLAIASVLAGYIGLKDYFTGALHLPVEGHEGGHFVMMISLAAVITGTALGFFLYNGRRSETITNPLLQLLADKFRIDQIYDEVVVWFQQLLATVAAWIDTWIIGVGLVRGAAAAAALGGQLLRLFQAGNLQLYAFLFGLGVSLMVLFRLVW